MVITNSSDADSSGDSKIIAHSVEGEDDLVDVSMKNTDETLRSRQHGASDRYVT
jgi:ubiquitin carboxyl-terminal hydrolase 4/11